MDLGKRSRAATGEEGFVFSAIGLLAKPSPPLMRNAVRGCFG